MAQRTEGFGKEPQHTHHAETHSHDHYHVTHHHGGGPLTEWQHRTSWHTHAHNHTTLTHTHDCAKSDEQASHDKEAHMHDHASPTE